MSESKGDVKSTSSTIDELKAVSRRVVPKGFYDFTLVGNREPYAPPTIVGFMEYSDPRCLPGPRLHLRNAPGMGVEGAARSLVFDNVDREVASHARSSPQVVCATSCVSDDVAAAAGGGDEPRVGAALHDLVLARQRRRPARHCLRSVCPYMHTRARIVPLDMPL
jgi:hypothetical protein